MTTLRARSLHLIAFVFAALLASGVAHAQSYPTRPVRIVVPVAPGGATDIIARLLGQWLGERLGQAFVVENRPGGGGNIGTEAVVRAPADGYTLLLISPPNMINEQLYENLNYKLSRDVAPVAGIMRSSLIMSVTPSIPVKNVQELVAYAAGNPGKINMASAGIGSGNHVTGELFKLLTGVQMAHVPYRGAAPALTDLLAGHVQVMFASTLSMIDYVKAGKLRALAVTSASRLEMLPEVPSIAETVPGYDGSEIYGLGAPKNTDAEIIRKLNAEVGLWLQDPKIKARFNDFGAVPLFGSAADFEKMIADEIEKWTKVIKLAGIRPE
jgi:tripartite-type tricarboxylate transporter receptor subunit TctC